MVKKIFLIFISYFIFINNSYSVTGNGEIVLSNHVISGYIRYLDMNSVHNSSYGAEVQKGNPSFFAVSKSGREYGYSYCPRGKQCVFDPTLALQGCRKRANERCYIFDRKRKIVWENKNYKISRKANSSEIREILEELGFTGNKKNNSSVLKSTEEKKPKITKKNNNLSNNIVKELKELDELFNSGALSKEEFEKAKKKILN